MTDPQFYPQPDGGDPGSYPPPGYQPPPGYPPSAYPGAYYDPMAPNGRHPVTGEPYSDKSKAAAGLLQLLGLLGLLGIGRIYMGQTAFGVAQLVGCLILAALTFGVGLIVPVIWGIVDMIVLMAGSPRDQYGRLLK